MSTSSRKPRSLHATEFASVFGRLRAILAQHAGGLTVTDDSPTRYCLEGKAGPATVAAWGGKTRRATIPVAWAQVGKSYVSFHLMPAYGDAALRNRISEKLNAHMQGKSCFNFTKGDEPLFKELEQLTARGMLVFRRAGFVA